MTGPECAPRGPSRGPRGAARAFPEQRTLPRSLRGASLCGRPTSALRFPDSRSQSAVRPTALMVICSRCFCLAVTDCLSENNRVGLQVECSHGHTTVSALIHSYNSLQHTRDHICEGESPLPSRSPSSSGADRCLTQTLRAGRTG